ncbi:vWA domain-containing protein [Oceaniglobus indicus]|uniref:vWA domain-containing protein n=1 Tax=Oceaniglobus indicus TaxID=2047749 RepID=UPI000C1865B1|nr:VWA domain-containing protein [Oceaniglobus indicus]
MNDPLDDLTDAMRRATPAPDREARARNLARAQEIFDATQGSASGVRSRQDRPTFRASLRTGAARMFHSLTTKGGLTATTALVACAVFVALPDTRGVLFPTADRDRSPVTAGVDSPATEPAVEFVPVDDVFVDPSPRFAPIMPSAAPEMGSTRTFDAPVGADQGMTRQTKTSAMPPPMEPAPLVESDTETFANADENPVKIAADDPVSTFSTDTDTASYAVIRSSLLRGQMPPSDAVRIEEMVNYFPYAYPAPQDDAAFRATVTVTQTPWNADTRLLKIGLQGAMPAIAERPPLNLVFLIDTSGSMNGPDRLGLLVQSFRLMLTQLRPEDEIAIVTYAGSAGLALPPTPTGERTTILNALETLAAGGSTAGQAGLQQAYAIAESMTETGEVSRVLLATDGDFNVGLSNPDDLKDFIADKRNSGTYLSVLGFGRGNLDDATMQALAQTGNGTAAYIDTLSEAQKVLVDQLTGALFPIADDAKVQVEFNPAAVAEYRLIGYETRALRREDFNNDAVDAGEIGAGHQVTALYEVTPVGSPATLNDTLRYGDAKQVRGDADELGLLRLRAKAPGAQESTLTEVVIPNAIAPADPDTAFAAAIAGFGQLLRDGKYLNGWSYDDAIDLGAANTGADPYGYRREAVSLMRLAQTLAE